MTAGVPWSVSAVDPETWDTAREAARRAGLSVGEWLQQAIRDNAGSKPGPVRNAKEPVRDYGYEALAERIDLLLRRSEPAVPAPAHSLAPAGPNHSIATSLDALTGRIDHSPPRRQDRDPVSGAAANPEPGSRNQARRDRPPDRRHERPAGTGNP
jgi:hypothetical protein